MSKGTKRNRSKEGNDILPQPVNLVEILTNRCMSEMRVNGVYSWYIEGGTLIQIDTSLDKVAAEFLHDSHDSRTASYPKFRTEILTELYSLGIQPKAEIYDEDNILLASIEKLGNLKADGIMNFQIVRAPHDMRKTVAQHLCKGTQYRGIEHPPCAPDRGVSKDLVTKLVGHPNEITTVGILYDNATAKQDEGPIDMSFFPADRNEFEQTGLVIGIQTSAGKSCICICGYNYEESGRNYRTYRGIITESSGRKIEFNGLSTRGSYLEPTIEKLAADECYNGESTGLSSRSRMLAKYGGDEGQRIMAGGAARQKIKCTLTTGDGNMFAFSLGGIRFMDKEPDIMYFPVVYAKMRSLQDPEQSVQPKEGPQSLIMSAWPDQGVLSDEEVQLRKKIKTKEEAINTITLSNQEISHDIQEIDDFTESLQDLLEKKVVKELLLKTIVI